MFYITIKFSGIYVLLCMEIYNNLIKKYFENWYYAFAMKHHKNF